MLLIYGSLLAGLIPVIWINYLRKIDLFEQESLKNIIILFVLGGLSTFLIEPIHWLVYDPLEFSLNGTDLNDFLYCILGIGLPEELLKLLPVLLFLRVKKKQLNEPIDWIIYGSASALGFSFIENILYVYRYGYEVIPGRAIISSPMHMFFTAMCVYGFVLYSYRTDVKWRKLMPLYFLFLGILAHAIFDFFLFSFDNGFGFLLSFLFFMLVISVFAAIINNSLNHSTYFTYEKVINSDKVSKWITRSYLILFGLYMFGCIFLGNEGSIAAGFASVNKLYVMAIVVMAGRLTRIKLVEKKWHPVRLEFPFRYVRGSGVQIRGEGFNETFINQYLAKEVRLFPFPLRINPNKRYLKAVIEKKIFTDSEDTVYLAKVFKLGSETEFTYLAIKPKMSGVTEFNSKKPIAGLYTFKDGNIPESFRFSNQDLKFNHWVEILPVKESTITVVQT